MTGGQIMATSVEQQLQAIFPGLKTTQFNITSPQDETYNCIAWAAGDNTRWWDPDPMGQYYWPPDAPRYYSLDAYKRAFETIGYSECNGVEYGPGIERIAIFVKGNNPAHAARQIAHDRWTSKLGQSFDISHELHGVSCKDYGSPAIILCRPADVASLSDS